MEEAEHVLELLSRVLGNADEARVTDAGLDAASAAIRVRGANEVPASRSPVAIGPEFSGTPRTVGQERWRVASSVGGSIRRAHRHLHASTVPFCQS